MAGSSPRPKIADGAIICITVALMGAPGVLGNHLNQALQAWLFWGGLVGLIAFVAWRWGAWFIGLAKAEEPAHGIDIRGGAYVGRDVSGTLYSGETVNVYHAPPPTWGKTEKQTAEALARATELEAKTRHLDALMRAREAEQKSKPETESIYETLARRKRAERDTKLKDAIKYAATGSWDSPPLQPTQGGLIAKAERELQKFQEYAVDDNIKVWGQHPVTQMYEPIPASYWRGHRVRFHSLFLDKAEMDVATLPRPPYWDLMVSKVEVEALWPPNSEPAYVLLREAARTLFEAVEGTPFGNYLARQGGETEIFQFIAAAFATYLQMYGATPPSRVTRPIDRVRATNLHWMPGTDSLGELIGNRMVFENVCVTRADLQAFADEMGAFSETEINRGKW